MPRIRSFNNTASNFDIRKDSDSYDIYFDNVKIAELTSAGLLKIKSDIQTNEPL